jgi:hypothetical protein
VPVLLEREVEVVAMPLVDELPVNVVLNLLVVAVVVVIPFINKLPDDVLVRVVVVIVSTEGVVELLSMLRKVLVVVGAVRQ